MRLPLLDQGADKVGNDSPRLVDLALCLDRQPPIDEVREDKRKRAVAQMMALGGEEVSELLHPLRRGILDGIDGGAKRGQCDDVQRDVVKSLADVYCAVFGLAKLLLNDVEKPGALAPEGRKQVLDVFELEGRLEQLSVNLQCRRSISTSISDTGRPRASEQKGEKTRTLCFFGGATRMP
jgi:hypothetical protein